MTKLIGKRFWLVGGSAGIGRQLALKLALQGVAVVISGRDPMALEQTLNDMTPVQTAKGEHSSVKCDVTVLTEVKNAVQAVGEIDGLIYCAGTYEPMTARNSNIDKLEKIVDVNLTGALRVLEPCIARFLNQGNGHIVLFGSVSGYLGLPNAWGYGSTKAALIHLAENLRCDLQGSGILVQICNPGFVTTRLTQKNNFFMPFIMSAEKAADQIVKGMAKERFEIAFPFLMVALLKILATLPRSVYFTLIALFKGK